MRIAFDAKRAYHNHRGLGNYSRDVIRLLTTFAPGNEYLLCAVPSEQYSFPHTQTIAPMGIWKYLPSLWRSGGCLNQLKGTDVYWGLSGELPYGIHRTGIRTIVTMHDAIYLRYPELYSTTYRLLFRHKMQYACDVADTIVAISEQTKRDLIDFFHADEKKIQVVYQGCSHIFRQPVTDEQTAAVKEKYHLPEQYILQVGAIEPRKNLQNLVRAVAAARISLPVLAVGGRTAYTEQTEQVAKQAGVNLQCRSDIAFADFPALYKGAALFCYPSVFEGFGIPILEAMCIGVPVLTSTGSCFAETGGEAAAYANPTDIDNIARQMQRILNDKTLQQQMVEKGKKQAGKFTDERVAENLCGILRQSPKPASYKG